MAIGLLLAACNLSGAPTAPQDAPVDDAANGPTTTPTVIAGPFATQTPGSAPRGAPTGITPQALQATVTIAPTQTAQAVVTRQGGGASGGGSVTVGTSAPPAPDDGSVAPLGVREATATVFAPGGTGDGSPAAEIPFPTTFNETYTVNVQAGNTLLVEYTVTLTNPGTGRVFVLVRDPGGSEVARLTLTETVEDVEEIPVASGGEYTILVAYENLRGNYSVQYSQRTGS